MLCNCKGHIYEHQPGMLEITGSNPIQGSSVFFLDCFLCLPLSIYMTSFVDTYKGIFELTQYWSFSTPEARVLLIVAAEHGGRGSTNTSENKL